MKVTEGILSFCGRSNFFCKHSQLWSSEKEIVLDLVWKVEVIWAGNASI